jgi:hypothetical protein
LAFRNDVGFVVAQQGCGDLWSIGGAIRCACFTQEFTKEEDTVSTPQDPNQPSPPPGERGQTETPWWQKPTEVIATPPVTPAQQPPPPPASPRAGTPQYPQPYGHGQPAQPGQLAPAATTTGKGSKGKVVLIVAIIGGIVAVVLVLALIGLLSAKTLDVNSVQAGVQQALKDPVTGYGSDDIKDVRCNNGQNPMVGKGDSFTCEVSVMGKKRQVTATFLDDNGTYQVGLPQLGEGGK